MTSSDLFSDIDFWDTYSYKTNIDSPIKFIHFLITHFLLPFFSSSFLWEATSVRGNYIWHRVAISLSVLSLLILTFFFPKKLLFSFACKLWMWQKGGSDIFDFVFFMLWYSCNYHIFNVILHTAVKVKWTSNQLRKIGRYYSYQ